MIMITNGSFSVRISAAFLREVGRHILVNPTVLDEVFMSFASCGIGCGGVRW